MLICLVLLRPHSCRQAPDDIPFRSSTSVTSTGVRSHFLTP
jgi:hypothetical protein